MITLITIELLSPKLTATAVFPYTTECSPCRITFPGADTLTVYKFSIPFNIFTFITVFTLHAKEPIKTTDILSTSLLFPNYISRLLRVPLFYRERLLRECVYALQFFLKHCVHQSVERIIIL